MAPTRKNILVVDDDADFGEILGTQLALLEEFDVQQAYTGATALELAAERSFDAIILDIRLPDIEGREVCRLMRRMGVNAPIILLTVADTDADIILGFDSGANDYVTKPCKLPVLVARLRAQLRQHDLSEHAALTIGPYSFLPGTKTLVDSRTDKRINLTEKEAAILKYLIRSEGKSVPSEVLLRDVWGYRPGLATHTLETHVYRLRQKMESDPADPKILVSVPRGYVIAKD